MADLHSKEIRSKNITAIKGKNTKPEMLVRRFLHANGYPFIAKQRGAGGNPTKENLIIPFTFTPGDSFQLI